MVKVGYLPDISKNFGYFRNMAINYLNQKNWDGARSGLYNLNECLGTEYMVSISNRDYTEMVKETSTYQCNFCTMMIEKTYKKGTEDEYTKEIEVPTEIPTHQVKVFKRRLSDIRRFLTKKDTEECWKCPRCGEINTMRTTKRIIATKAKPYFLKVIPMPPIHGPGLDLDFQKNFKAWFWNAMEEVTYQEYLYRIEWSAQNNGEPMQSSWQDEGDRS